MNGGLGVIQTLNPRQFQPSSSLSNNNSSNNNNNNKEIRVCTNKPCLRQGSQEVLHVLKGIAPPNISVNSCGCLGRCGAGPNLVVLPGATYIKHCATAPRAAEIMAVVVCGYDDVGMFNSSLEALSVRKKAEVEMENGDFVNADILLTRAIELNPIGGIHYIYKDRSVARLAMKQTVAALEDAIEASSLAPKYPEVYIIGGDGTQKGAAVIYQEIRRRGLKAVVAGIPKTIDNDIPVIDKSFGFDTAVEEAQRAINAAHVEAESAENGIGVVKLMGRYCGFIAMYATLASRDVDLCLIPESPFYLEGEGGLLEYVEKRLKENGHMVIVVAEGAGQELLAAESSNSSTAQDASGNKLLQDVGLWISDKIKAHFARQTSMPITLKYIDPTYMIRAVPSNASDNVYCTLLAQSCVHGVMAGYTGFTSGLVNGRQTYIPFNRITEKQNNVVITDRMWARLLSSTNQPSFLQPKDEIEVQKQEEPPTQLLDGDNSKA